MARVAGRRAAGAWAAGMASGRSRWCCCPGAGVDARMMRGKVTPLIPTRFLEGLPQDRIEIYDRAEEEPMEADEAVAFGKALIDQLRGGR